MVRPAFMKVSASSGPSARANTRSTAEVLACSVSGWRAATRYAAPRPHRQPRGALIKRPFARDIGERLQALGDPPGVVDVGVDPQSLRQQRARFLHPALRAQRRAEPPRRPGHRPRIVQFTEISQARPQRFRALPRSPWSRASRPRSWLAPATPCVLPLLRYSRLGPPMPGRGVSHSPPARATCPRKAHAIAARRASSRPSLRSSARRRKSWA